MLVTAVERKYLQRIIFNFHKKNPAKATQDDHNDDDDEAHDDAPDNARDDDDELADDVVNNIVAVAATLGRCCVSLKFQRASHATFLLLLWFSQRKMAAKLRKNFAMEHLLVHTKYINIIPFFFVILNAIKVLSLLSRGAEKKKLVANILY